MIIASSFVSHFLSAKANLNAVHGSRLEWVERELNPLGTVVFGFTDQCVYLSTLPTHIKPLLGIEPRSRGYKSLVLPLNYKGIC